MNIEQAKRLLADCKREELRDHAFGDREVYWMRGNVDVASGYFGGGHCSVTVEDGEDVSSFDGEEAKELASYGTLRTIERNDSTGPDQYRGLVMDIPAASAPGIRTFVVSAKFPEKYIIRGIKKWSTIDAVHERMKPYLILFGEDEYQLTSCVYFTPHYLFYGSGDIDPGSKFYDGLYKFNHVGNGVYDNAQKLASW